MSDPNTTYILEIDGGGERGYLSSLFLQKFVQLWGINQSDIWKNFDVICGTSVGGILALGLALGKTVDEVIPFFTEQGPYVFSLGTITGIPPIPPVGPSPSIRPNAAQKLALIIANTPFYNSSGFYKDDYGHGLLYKTIDTIFGTNTLQDVKTNVIIPTFEQNTKTYKLCSNLAYADFSAQDELIRNVALATGAAPVYLPPLIVTNNDPFTLNGQYIDGGVYQNNPAQFGYTLGKMIKPNSNRCCILSVGTGIGEYGFDDDPELSKLYPPDTTLKTLATQLGCNLNNLNNLQKNMLDTKVSEINFDTVKFIFELFSIASTGGQESVAKSLFLESSYTLDQLYYYRFQPKLDTTKDPALDNTDPALLQYYRDLATEWFNDDIENISTFLGHLTA
jgi:patatin-like phospholipase/acyl hydrolase